jgi:hypothetical protein
MAVAALQVVSVAEAADAAAAALVSVRHWGGSSFINLPLIYPSGSFVTVKLEQVGREAIRVSDNGFAYRELESIGVQRSFAKTANSIAEAESLEVNKRAIFVDVPHAQLSRAICDVAIASWQVADRIFSRAAEEDEAEIEDYLRQRLASVFGADHVNAEQAKIVGASTSEWEVSAVVELPNRVAVFHAVSNHSNSVFRTSTAFHDLAALDNPPSLTAVVRSKAALGPKLNLLAQAGNVIEEDQPNNVYLRAAA